MVLARPEIVVVLSEVGREGEKRREKRARCQEEAGKRESNSEPLLAGIQIPYPYVAVKAGSTKVSIGF